ncbi:unnamed protein product, partial [Meganyctiphanes norvegica]
MDASNEFKVYISRDSQERLKNRAVPVINKVFSPSHFMLAQRKTSLYKAMSGVSFQDAEEKSRKTSSGSKEHKKSESRSASVERDKSYINYKNDKANLGSSSQNTSQSSQEYKSYDALRHYRGLPDEFSPHHESRRAQRGTSKDRQLRKHRSSLDSSGYHDRSPSYEQENGDRSRRSSSKEPKLKHRSSSSSAVRSRSVSASDNLKIVHQNTVHQNTDDNSDQQPPVRPPRTRSASRTRNSVVKSSSASAVIMTGIDRGRMTEDVIKLYRERHKEDIQVSAKEENSYKAKNIELRSRSRSRRRTEKQSEEEENTCRSRSRSFKNNDAGTKNKKDEPEGGYFSMEKDNKNENSPTLVDDYMENDKCIESIYVCPAINKQHSHLSK